MVINHFMEINFPIMLLKTIQKFQSYYFLALVIKTGDTIQYKLLSLVYPLIFMLMSVMPHYWQYVGYHKT